MLTVIKKGVAYKYAFGMFDEMKEKISDLQFLHLVVYYDADNVFGMMESINEKLVTFNVPHVFVYLDLNSKQNFEELSEFEQSDITDIFKFSQTHYYLTTS